MATVTRALRTALVKVAAVGAVAAVAFAAAPALGQQEADEAELRAGSGELAPLPGQASGQGRRPDWNRDRDDDDARLVHSAVGFDVPTRAELFGRASETLRVSRQLIRERERELVRVRREYQDYLESLPEVREARRAVRQASAELEQARQDVQRQLEDDEMYQETLARAAVVDDLIEAAHRRYGVSREQLTELAEQRMFYSERLDEIRRERADLSAVEEARQQLTEAARQQEEIESEMRERMREAPQIAEAREQLEQAQQRHRAARIDYAGARAGYIEAERHQAIQMRVRRLRPVVHDPFWNLRIPVRRHHGFVIVR